MCCTVTETTHLLMTSQRSVWCMLCGSERSGGQERSFRWVPGTHSETETNSDSNTEQQCADCQRGWTLTESQAEESAHKLRQPGSSNCMVWLNTAKDHKGALHKTAKDPQRTAKEHYGCRKLAPIQRCLIFQWAPRFFKTRYSLQCLFCACLVVTSRWLHCKNLWVTK